MIHIVFARKKIRIAGNRNGFTLVDILVGLAMASVLMVAMVSLFTTMGRSYTTQNVAADVQQVARAGVELMSR
jgi:Tfp pilus assembly protein PilW